MGNGLREEGDGVMFAVQKGEEKKEDNKRRQEQKVNSGQIYFLKSLFLDKYNIFDKFF